MKKKICGKCKFYNHEESQCKNKKIVETYMGDNRKFRGDDRLFYVGSIAFNYEFGCVHWKSNNWNLK